MPPTDHSGNTEKVWWKWERSKCLTQMIRIYIKCSNSEINVWSYLHRILCAVLTFHISGSVQINSTELFSWYLYATSIYAFGLLVLGERQQKKLHGPLIWSSRALFPCSNPPVVMNGETFYAGGAQIFTSNSIIQKGTVLDSFRDTPHSASRNMKDSGVGWVWVCYLIDMFIFPAFSHIHAYPAYKRNRF